MKTATAPTRRALRVRSAGPTAATVLLPRVRALADGRFYDTALAVCASCALLPEPEGPAVLTAVFDFGHGRYAVVCYHGHAATLTPCEWPAAAETFARIADATRESREVWG